MNSRFHKHQAEELIKKINVLLESKPVYWMDSVNITASLAQIHATLATVPDEDE